MTVTRVTTNHCLKPVVKSRSPWVLCLTEIENNCKIFFLKKNHPISPSRDYAEYLVTNSLKIIICSVQINGNSVSYRSESSLTQSQVYLCQKMPKGKYHHTKMLLILGMCVCVCALQFLTTNGQSAQLTCWSMG